MGANVLKGNTFWKLGVVLWKLKSSTRCRTSCWIQTYAMTLSFGSAASTCAAGTTGLMGGSAVSTYGSPSFSLWQSISFQFVKFFQLSYIGAECSTVRVKCQRNSAARSNSPPLNLNAEKGWFHWISRYVLHIAFVLLTTVSPFSKVVNHVTLVVAQNTVDYEALDLYTVNVS